MNKTRKRIILVDDIVSNLDLGRVMLKPFFEVYPAASAAKLFNLLEVFIPDLILLDIEMPEINGYEAMKMLKEDDRYVGIPVIFLTANESESGEQEGYGLGAADYVTKPFSVQILLNRIEKLLPAIPEQ